MKFLSACKLLVVLLVAMIGGIVQAQSLVQIQSIVKHEISFTKFDRVSMGARESCPEWIAEAPECRRYEVVYKGVFLSGIFIPNPTQAKTLAIYLPGHEPPQYDDMSTLADLPESAVFPDGANFVGRLLSDGADVLIVFMPGRGIGPLEHSGADLRSFKRYAQHEAFVLLDGPGNSAAAYFVAHIKAFLDRFGKDYERVVMYGRSGGGWSTTIAAAVEPRIECSISFFGTLPMSLRLPREDLIDDPQNRVDMGDFEQHALLLWRILDYTDLYALATIPLRTHAQIYNERDECCFSGSTKGALVDRMFVAKYPRVRGFSVRILPVRSEADHMNLDDQAYVASQEICPIKK